MTCIQNSYSSFALGLILKYNQYLKYDSVDSFGQFFQLLSHSLPPPLTSSAVGLVHPKRIVKHAADADLDGVGCGAQWGVNVCGQWAVAFRGNLKRWQTEIIWVDPCLI